MNQLNQDLALKMGIEKNERPVKVLQFGEGNFLRAFIDWMVDSMNSKGLFNGKISIVQPLAQGMIGMMAEQDYLYTPLPPGYPERRRRCRQEGHRRC